MTVRMNDFFVAITSAQIVIAIALALIFGTLGWKLIQKTTLEIELIGLKIEKLKRELAPATTDTQNL